MYIKLYELYICYDMILCFAMCSTYILLLIRNED